MFGKTFQNCTGTLEQLKSSETFRTLFWNIFYLFGNISDCAKNISGLCLGTFSIVPKHFIYVCKTFQNCTGTLEHLKKF